MAIGTEKGKVLLYDMRYPLPLLTMNHHYRQAIHTIAFHKASRKLISADKKIIKIYDKDSGKLFTNIEPKTGVNSFELCADSGLIMVPQEQQKIGTYFIPSLGNAPKWCAFLENLTEEMEESQNTSVYEDYKFLTMNELQQLNANHLIGTPMLKAHLHGFFIEMRAYQKLLSVADPFAYERYRKELIASKLNQMREKRIQLPTNKQAEVNREFVNELMKKAGDKNKSGQAAETLMSDSRFGKMFTESEFKIDRNSEAYKLIKPQESSKQRRDDVDSVNGEEESEGE